MNSFRERIASASPLLLASAAYALIAGAFFWAYRYQINTDGVAYLSIAGKYAAGSWGEALNGFWAPLFSWLLAPLLALGIEGLLASKVLTFLLGFAMLAGVRFLLAQFSMEEHLRRGILLASAVPAAYFALAFVSPDLLFTVILLFYLGIVFSPSFGVSPKAGAWCGALGAVAYFSRTFAFPFFLAHFVLIHAVLFWVRASREERRRVCASFLAGMGAFVLLSAPWVALLSAKYGSFTFGNSGNYNFAVYANPDYASFEGNPFEFIGLLPPPDPLARSIWDDPSLSNLPLDPWRPSVSDGSILYYAKLVAKNAYQTGADLFQRFSLLSSSLLIGYAFVSLDQLRKKVADRRILFPMLTIVLYAGGYAMLHTEERYLWIVYLLLLAMGGQALSLILRAGYFQDRIRRTGAVALLFLLFLIVPAFKLPYRVGTGREFYELGTALKEMGVRGRVASSGNWGDSVVLSYHTGADYYGVPREERAEEDLRAHEIDYYLAWEGSGRDIPEGAREVPNDSLRGLRVYRLAKGVL